MYCLTGTDNPGFEAQAYELTLRTAMDKNARARPPFPLFPHTRAAARPAHRKNTPGRACASSSPGHPPQIIPKDKHGLPAFDLMLLGMGSDGHVGSLYPNRAEVSATGKLVLPVDKGCADGYPRTAQASLPSVAPAGLAVGITRRASPADVPPNQTAPQEAPRKRHLLAPGDERRAPRGDRDDGREQGGGGAHGAARGQGRRGLPGAAGERARGRKAEEPLFTPVSFHRCLC